MNDYSGKQKELARRCLGRFVAENFSEQRVENSRVLTLLGPKTHELEQIWDPLGVKQSNITVIESDPEVYEIIKKQNLGVQLLEPQDIDTYLQETNQLYDIINLDYKGYLSPARTHTLSAIGENGLLGKDGIIATWYSGRRERQDVHTFMAMHWVKHLMNGLKGIKNSSHQPIIEEIVSQIPENKIQEFLKTMTENKIPRDEAITIATQYFLNNLTDYKFPAVADKIKAHKQICEYVEKTEEYKQLNQTLVQEVLHNQIPEGKYPDEYVTAIKRIRKASLDHAEKSLDDRITLASMYVGSVKIATADATDKYLQKYPFFRELSDIQKHNFVSFLVTAGKTQYIPLDTFRLKYIGEGNTPMFVDINHMKDFDTADLVPLTIKKGKLDLPTKKYSSDKFWKKVSPRINEFYKGFANQLLTPFQERIHCEDVEFIEEPTLDELTPREILLDEFSSSKEAVNEMIKSNVSYEEINGVFPEYTLAQLPRMKAVLTMREKGIKMGRKKKETINEVVQVEQTPTNNKERPQQTINPFQETTTISNKELELLLQDNYTPKEISDVFNVDVWRVRGLKAHLTRKKNQAKVA